MRTDASPRSTVHVVRVTESSHMPARERVLVTAAPADVPRGLSDAAAPSRISHNAVPAHTGYWEDERAAAGHGRLPLVDGPSVA